MAYLLSDNSWTAQGYREYHDPGSAQATVEISDMTLSANTAIHRSFRPDHSARRPDGPSNRRLRSRPVKKPRLKVADLPSFYKEALIRSGRINFVKQSDNGKKESRHG